MWIIVLQRIGLEFLWDILFFPIWWYTFGALHAGRVCRDIFMNGNYSLAPFLWLRNLFVPMYGQTDWQGRLMSAFIRGVNVIIRSILLFGWFLICLIVFFAWFSAPVAVVLLLLQTFRV